MSKLITLLILLFTNSVFAKEIPDQTKSTYKAIPIFEATEYLRKAKAPDYWLLSAFYIPQTTSSDCSVASVTMVINALLGFPQNADNMIFSEKSLLAKVNNSQWIRASKDQGPGVKFNDLENYLRQTLDKTGLANAKLKAVHPVLIDDNSLQKLRKALIENEASAANIMIIYFNQGVLIGNWDGPHVSVVGAFDAKNDRVLIMDVDRNSYLPYWTTTPKLLAALAKPEPADQGILAGEVGGYVMVIK